MPIFRSDWMRNRHGCGPQNRFCGECAHYLPEDDPEAQSKMMEIDMTISMTRIDGICQAEPKEGGFWVCLDWKACGLFKSHFRADQEQAEACGQMRITWT